MKQLALSMSSPRTWGGRRKGAGRKPGAASRMPHVERPWHDRGTPVHVTVPIVYGLRLRNRGVAREIGLSFGELVGREREETFRIVAFTLQSDHAHLIVEASDRAALSRGMRAVTIRLAKAVSRALGRRGPVVRDRYHAHVLATPTEASRALGYVLDNGRKHREPASEFVDGLDTRSSARWNLGLDASSSLVAAPRTYFMRMAHETLARARSPS